MTTIHKPPGAGRQRGAAGCLALLVSVVAMIGGAHAASAQRACDLYRALERRCGCPATENYFGNYGRKYCERFIQSAGWSAAG